MVRYFLKLVLFNLVLFVPFWLMGQTTKYTILYDKLQIKEKEEAQQLALKLEHKGNEVITLPYPEYKFGDNLCSDLKIEGVFIFILPNKEQEFRSDVQYFFSRTLPTITNPDKNNAFALLFSRGSLSSLVENAAYSSLTRLGFFALEPINLQSNQAENAIDQLHETVSRLTAAAITPQKQVIADKLTSLNIELPQAPVPVGSYVPYVIANKFVYINQIALSNGSVLYPGRIGETVSEAEAKLATKQTLLNILAVLKQATGGNLDQVKKCVQLTGFYATTQNFTAHASIMNEASDLLASIFEEKGKHARATVGVYSLPLNSSVEIQAVFEIQ